MEVFGARQKNEVSSGKKKGGRRASIGFVVGTFFCVFLGQRYIYFIQRSNISPLWEYASFRVAFQRPFPELMICRTPDYLPNFQVYYRQVSIHLCNLRHISTHRLSIDILSSITSQRHSSWDTYFFCCLVVPSRSHTPAEFGRACAWLSLSYSYYSNYYYSCYFYYLHIHAIIGRCR